MRVALAVLLVLTLMAGCLESGSQELEAATTPASTLEILPSSAVATHDYRDREADVAIDPTDPDHVAIFYNERPEPYLTGEVALDPITPAKIRQALAVSQDGGETWTRHVLPTTGEAPPDSAWNLYCAMGDPITFFDANGLLHIVTLALTCGGPALTVGEAIVHATTADDGATWSEPNVAWVGATLAVLFQDREWAAIDRNTGSIGIAWTSFQGGAQRNALSVVFSEDGGATWTLPVELDDRYPITAATNWFLHAAWGPDHRFHVTGASCGESTEPRVDCLSHWIVDLDGSATQTVIALDPCAPPDGASRFGYAASAIDASTGRVAVVSPVLDGGSVVGSCLAVSDDLGATWARATMLGKRADHPWVAFDRDGGIAVVYLEVDETALATPTVARIDPVGLNVRERQTLDAAFDADTDDDGQLEYGDYDAMVIEADRLIWSLTLPNQEGRKDPGGWNDLDVWAFRARLG